MHAKSALSSGVLTLVAAGALIIGAPSVASAEDSSSESSSSASGNGAQCQSEVVVNGQVVSFSGDCAGIDPSWFVAPDAAAPDQSESTSTDSSTSESTSTDSSTSESTATDSSTSESTATDGTVVDGESTSQSNSTATGDGAQCQSQEVVNGQVVSSSTDCADVQSYLDSQYPNLDWGFLF